MKFEKEVRKPMTDNPYNRKGPFYLNLQQLTPRIGRRYLYFVAAIVWTFAGSMLLFRGILLFMDDDSLVWFRLTLSIIAGITFYWLLFSKISRKHTVRIAGMKLEKPCLFSFFNFRSYVLMTLMITAGISLRKSGILTPVYLSVIYVTMGIPLFISSFRFYYAFAIYPSNLII
jgi:hypothetical protein